MPGPEFAHDHRTPAVFLDRDGTLMQNVPYCSDPKKVAVYEDVPVALLELRERGFRLVVITNQSGIGRGYFPEDDYHAVHTELLRQLGAQLIDAAYFCPDDPQDGPSECRKPAPGMLRQAAADHEIDLGRSYMIGDHASDMECAKRAGLAGAILVLTGHGSEQAAFCQSDYTAPNFAAAAQWVLSDFARFTP